MQSRGRRSTRQAGAPATARVLAILKGAPHRLKLTARHYEVHYELLPHYEVGGVRWGDLIAVHLIVAHSAL